jgi:hypothetical protein
LARLASIPRKLRPRKFQVRRSISSPKAKTNVREREKKRVRNRSCSYAARTCCGERCAFGPNRTPFPVLLSCLGLSPAASLTPSRAYKKRSPYRWYELHPDRKILS